MQNEKRACGTDLHYGVQGCTSSTRTDHSGTHVKNAVVPDQQHVVLTRTTVVLAQARVVLTCSTGPRGAHRGAARARR
eukprot:712473-Rhodomonas_salina.1